MITVEAIFDNNAASATGPGSNFDLDPITGAVALATDDNQQGIILRVQAKDARY